MREFKIKGISFRVDNTFYVDVEPSQEMYLAYDYVIGEIMNDNEDYVNEYGVEFLNVSYDLDRENGDFSFALSTYLSDYDWLDIKYTCSSKEKKAILDFINEWKDKVPKNPDGAEYWDDTEYVYALSDDIPWKNKVLR